MTKEEAKLVLDNARPQTKEIDRQFYDDEDLNNALDMAINALEIVEEFEKAQIITGGRLNGRTYAYKCGLEDGKRKAIEQQSDDCVSRAEVLNQLKEWRDCEFVKMTNPYHYLEKRIQSLPPVTPTFSNDATNYDVLKAVLGNTSAFRIKDTMEFEKGFESWFSKPYKRGNKDGSN